MSEKPPEKRAGATLLLLGEGAGSDLLAAKLRGDGLGGEADGILRRPLGSLPRDLAARIAEARLVVCVVEGVPRGRALEIQRLCHKTGTAALFLTVDETGPSVGPTVVPGRTPCYGCAMLSLFGARELAAEELLAEVGELTAPRGEATPELEAACALAAGEVRRVLGGRVPELAGRLLRSRGGWAAAGLAFPQREGCPLCGGERPEEPGSLAGPALAAEIAMAELEEAAPLRVREEAAPPPRVGILGGGTAGYLTALALRAKLPEVSVTLIESEQIPVIGVGEATTPLLPQFLHVDLGLDIHELFRAVRPTFKLGIRFDWGASPRGSFPYPFGPVRVLEPRVYGGNLEDCSLGASLMAAAALPVYPDGRGGRLTRLGGAVAYHLHNGRFAAFLAAAARARGVAVETATVAEVVTTADGTEVEELITTDGRRRRFDLYVDCSGFRSVLLGDALGSPFLDYRAGLLVDAALPARAPHRCGLPPFTRAEKLAAGWMWTIPQEAGDHCGYVFSSAFLRPEAAAAELRARVPGVEIGPLLSFQSGRHHHFWKGNVVGLGNAYGFVEPLESTALHLLIRQIGLLLRAYPWRGAARATAPALDRRVGGWWDYVAWFLALHYRFDRAPRSAFWRHCAEAVDVSRHGELIEAFRRAGPLSYQPHPWESGAPDPLWGSEGIDVVLLGQGAEGALPRPVRSRRRWEKEVRRRRALARAALSHATVLAEVEEHPEVLDAFGAALGRVGPAFPGLPRRPGVGGSG